MLIDLIFVQFQIFFFIVLFSSKLGSHFVFWVLNCSDMHSDTIWVVIEVNSVVQV